MADGDSTAQLAVVILLLGLCVPALATAHDYAGTPLSYSETVVVNDNGTTQVSEAATEAEDYGQNITIVTNGQTLEEGTDYDWNAETGVINWYNTANSNDGDDATVDYVAYQRTEETAMAWTIISPLMGLFGLFGLVSAVRTLWSTVAEVWELV